MSKLTERPGPYVGGERVTGGGEMLTTRNPATGEAIATVETAHPGVVDDAVAAARQAFPDWRDTDPDERGRIVYRIGQLVREHRENLAELESRDQGKPRSQAHSDMGGAARYFEYYAGAADKLEGSSVPVGTGGVDYTLREPYGVSAQVTPWNFPGNLFARGVAPALVAGNTVVVKPAPQTPLSSLRLVELCGEAGVPDGVVNVVPGAGDTGELLVGHEGVDQVTFTGSVPTGQAIMRESASHVRPVTLELGGKNPALVYPDADIEDAAAEIATGIFTNAGQVCSAADRAVVHESVADAFLDAVVAEAESYELGPNADMGPLCSREQFERVVEYIDVGQTEGARLVTGGGTPEAKPGGSEERSSSGNRTESGDDEDGGFYIEPTVFADVGHEMRIAQEEIFGPVLSVLTFSDTEEAVDIANGTEYGLTAGVFTTDISRAHTLARRLEAGNVYVNGWFGDTNQTPFGGYKQSGIGREKGLEALESYLQTKNVAIDLGEGGTLPGA